VKFVVDGSVPPDFDGHVYGGLKIEDRGKRRACKEEQREEIGGWREVQ